MVDREPRERSCSYSFRGSMLRSGTASNREQQPIDFHGNDIRSVKVVFIFAHTRGTFLSWPTTELAVGNLTKLSNRAMPLERGHFPSNQARNFVYRFSRFDGKLSLPLIAITACTFITRLRGKRQMHLLLFRLKWVIGSTRFRLTTRYRLLTQNAIVAPEISFALAQPFTRAM